MTFLTCTPVKTSVTSFGSETHLNQLFARIPFRSRHLLRRIRVHVAGISWTGADMNQTWKYEYSLADPAFCWDSWDKWIVLKLLLWVMDIVGILGFLHQSRVSEFLPLIYYVFGFKYHTLNCAEFWNWKQFSVIRAWIWTLKRCIVEFLSMIFSSQFLLL